MGISAAIQLHFKSKRNVRSDQIHVHVLAGSAQHNIYKRKIHRTAHGLPLCRPKRQDGETAPRAQRPGVHVRFEHHDRVFQQRALATGAPRY